MKKLFFLVALTSAFFSQANNNLAAFCGLVVFGGGTVMNVAYDIKYAIRNGMGSHPKSINSIPSSETVEKSIEQLKALAISEHRDRTHKCIYTAMQLLGLGTIICTAIADR